MRKSSAAQRRDTEGDAAGGLAPVAQAGLPPLALLALYVALGLAPLALYVALGLAPLAIAAASEAPRRGFWHELSSGLALIGFAMLLAEFLLSGRFRAISGRVGIDLTMRFHQLAARSLLGFLVAHPFLYAVPLLPDGAAAALRSVAASFVSAPLRAGVLAWLLLVALVLAAIWRDALPVRYEAWRLSHGLGAALVAAFGTHHALALGTSPLLAGFWSVLALVALASLVEVYLLKPLRQRRARWNVVANEKAADRMWRVTIEPRSGPGIPFDPGQFCWLNLGHSPFSLTEHPFSISSAPAERPRLEFTIKESGDFTDRVGRIRPGTPAYLDGPHGVFTPAGRAARPLVLIGGGVGFAPLLAILRQLRAIRWPHPVEVIYGNRVESQILCRDELEAIARTLDMRLHLVLSEPPPGWTGRTGEVTAENLAACLGRLDPEALCLVCGPVPMMDAVERALAALGVPDRNIVSERFTYT